MKTKTSTSQSPKSHPPDGRLAAALAEAQRLAAETSRREPASKVLAVRVSTAFHKRLSAQAEARKLPLAELVRVLLADAADRLDETTEGA